MKVLLWVFALVMPHFVAAQSAVEIALAQNVLSQLQAVSISEDVEYCGYIGIDAQGQLTATQPTRGQIDGCLSAYPHTLRQINASYHTHGAHSRAYFKELPSTNDMRSDAIEGINGYIATPGGRFWLINSAQRSATQLCGIGCLPRDPQFITDELGPVAQSYSYAQLVIALGQ